MKFSYPIVRQTGAGRWKIYAVGQPSSHIMDWRGCNFRLIAAPFQPVRGFASAEEAKEWAKVNLHKDGLRRYVGQKGDGSFFNDTKARVWDSFFLPDFVGPGRGVFSPQRNAVVEVRG